jgi:dsRNA-specific ribonuclease
VEEVLKTKAKNPDAKCMSDILYVVTGFGTQYLGAMDHPKAMGDVIESLIGAVYCDTGHDIAKTYPVRFLCCIYPALLANC